MNEGSPRVEPLAPSELDERQREWLRPFTDAKGRYANIFGVLARHMPLLDAWTTFGLYTMRGSSVPAHFREVLILRTARNCGSTYERSQHRRIAKALGMTEAELDAVDVDQATGNEVHDLAIACADELAGSSRLSDRTWEMMLARFGLDTTLDAIFTVGAYTTVAMVLNSCDVRIER